MRRVIAAAIIALSAALAAGCAGPGLAPAPSPPDPGPPSAAMPQACTKSGPVVFVVAGRQDSPAPVLTGSMQSAAATAVREGSAIGLVDLDGRSRLIMAGAFRDPGANPLALQAAQQHYLSSLTSAVEHVRAASPHADVLDALNVAGHAIRAACPYGGTIYLEDSGLQETGLVNFRQTGVLGAAPARVVVSFLARRHDLPYLAGMTVVLAGVGDTAPPQLPLSISQQDSVAVTWSAIAKAGGATSVRVDPAPLSGPAPAHVPPVLLVPVPLPAIPGAQVARDKGGVSYTLSDPLRDFAVGSAALTSVAEAALAGIAATSRPARPARSSRAPAAPTAPEPPPSTLPSPRSGQSRSATTSPARASTRACSARPARARPPPPPPTRACGGSSSQHRLPGPLERLPDHDAARPHTPQHLALPRRAARLVLPSRPKAAPVPWWSPGPSRAACPIRTSARTRRAAYTFSRPAAFTGGTRTNTPRGASHDTKAIHYLGHRAAAQEGSQP